MLVPGVKRAPVSEASPLRLFLVANGMWLQTVQEVPVNSEVSWYVSTEEDWKAPESMYIPAAHPIGHTQLVVGSIPR